MPRSQKRSILSIYNCFSPENDKLVVSLFANEIPEESATTTVLSSLESSGAFESGLARHQLQPDLHVELNSEDVELINSRVSRQNVTTFENMESILNTQVDKCVKN
uniref:Uncharacterized protein n=1 Tax=Theileria annulata TaxID=5874 RepID=A0A3B0MWX3_THEAN